MYPDILPTAVGQISLFGLKCGMQLFQAVLSPPVVRIKEGNIVAACLSQPQVSGGIGARVFQMDKSDTSRMRFLADAPR